MSVLPDSIGVSGSFLIDDDLSDAMDKLFREGSYTDDSIRHSSYQLRLEEIKVCSRASDVSGRNQSFEEFQQLRWCQGEDEEDGRAYVEIAPRQIAQLYTKEFFHFPENALGFVFARGLLHTLGLTPETTYVDPGFSGTLYITIVNNSENVIQLDRKMSIGRLFVFKLPKQVSKPYISGSDIGIEQQFIILPENWARD